MTGKAIKHLIKRGNQIQPNRTPLLGSSLKKEADEARFLELALRGYDLSKLRENAETETPAEIVNIS